jgi:Helix-turn-helix of insertion element transposase
MKLTTPGKIVNQAAQLVAEGELTDQVIANELGLERRTLWRWRRNTRFMAKVDAITDRLNSALARRAIAHKVRRIDRLNRDWLKLQSIMEARANDSTLANEPGGSTGLLVRTLKTIGQGKTSRVVEEFNVDAALLRELLSIEQQAAKELGQWTDKVAVRDESPKPIAVVVIKGVSFDDL